jgi:transposase
LAARHARSTNRYDRCLQALGISNGGNPGVVAAGAFGIRSSAATILRRLHAAPDPETTKVRILGVDDWAFRKGTRYGTILCDLERGCPIDLLPERSAESLANWLSKHPEIEVITRDRGGIYAEAARTGAPQARQVADRFHLLMNLTDVLRRILERHRSDLKTASNEIHVPVTKVDTDSDSAIQQAEPEPNVTASQQRRQTLYDDIQRLIRQGRSIRSISRELGIHRATLRRYANATEAPPIQKRYRPVSSTVLAGYSPTIDRLLNAGQTNLTSVYNQLRKDGYTGSINAVYRYVRKSYPDRKTHKRGSVTDQSAAVRNRRNALSPRAASYLLTKEATELSAVETRMLEQLKSQNTEIAAAASLAERFVSMAKHRKPEHFDSWLRDAAECSASEVRNFATGLSRDYDAVREGLTVPWSNGPVQGHINRLKLLKRSMYGRGSIELLRKRVLIGA